MSEEIKVYDKRVVQAEEPSANLLELVIRRNLPLETIEKVMELQERHERNEARKAFFDAKAEFKANMPTVIRDKKNQQYKSTYASENALIGTLNPHLSKFGLETSFDFPKGETGLSVTCILSHRQGHSESVTLSGPIDTSGSKNPLQQVKSTVTYLRKATFEAILGIASSDAESDDDGNAAGGNITTEQAAEITALIGKVAYVDGGKAFLNWLGVDSAATIPASDYKKAVSALNDIIRAKVKK